MSLLTALMIMGAVLLGIIFLCCGAIWMEKQKHSDEFDERQLLIRGRGYQLAFGVGFPYFLITLSLTINQVEGEKTVEPYLILLIGYAIQSLVFHTYCMIQHAALPVSQKPFVNFLGFLAIGSFWLYSAVRYLQSCPLSLVGYGSWGWAQLIGAFYVLALAFMYLIQLLRRDKE